MYSRAVWHEGDPDHKFIDAVPSNWLKDKVLYWPTSKKWKKAFSERSDPDVETWSQFTLIKVKFSSNNLTEARRGTLDTSAAEEVSRTGSEKRKPTSAKHDNYVAWSSLEVSEKENEPSSSANIVTLPSCPGVKAKIAITTTPKRHLVVKGKGQKILKKQSYQPRRIQSSDEPDSDDSVNKKSRPVAKRHTTALPPLPGLTSTPIESNGDDDVASENDAVVGNLSGFRREVTGDETTDELETAHQDTEELGDVSPDGNQHARDDALTPDTNNDVVTHELDHGDNSGSDARGTDGHRKRPPPKHNSPKMTYPLSDARFQKKMLAFQMRIENKLDILIRTKDVEESGLTFEPCTTLDEFKDLDKSVKESNEMKNKLVNLLKKVGGNYMRDHVSRGISRLMTHGVKQEMSMNGQQKDKYGFKKSVIFRLVLRAVGECHEHSTEKMIETAIGSHLKYAPFRRQKDK